MSNNSIIVVDDEKSIVKMIPQMLQVLGFSDVLGFDSPIRALEAMQNGIHPKLLLTDVVMPFINGHILAKEAQNLFPNMPVIFMTGNDNGLEKEMAKISPHRLNKPFEMKELKSILREIGLTTFKGG